MGTSGSLNPPIAQGFVAPPLSRKDIKEIVGSIHRLWATLNGDRQFDILLFADAIFPKIIENDFNLKAMPVSEMGDYLGISIPSENSILIREDIYNQAEEGNTDAQLVIAHELGHHILHGGIKHPKLASNSTHPSCCAETQADIFAEELLMPLPTQMDLFDIKRD